MLKEVSPDPIGDTNKPPTGTKQGFDDSYPGRASQVVRIMINHEQL